MRKFLFAFIAFIVSCQTLQGPRPPYVPPTRTDALGFAQKALDSGQPVDAIAWLLRTGELSVEELSLRTRAVEELKKAFGGLMDGARFGEALNWTDGLRLAGIEIPVPRTQEVQRKLLAHFLEKEWGAPAGALILQMMKLPGFTQEEILGWRDVLYRERNKAGLEELVSNYPGLVLTNEQKTWLAETTGAPDWLKGTVMVFVNKGIKVERGMGIPDIIIGSAFYIDRRGYLLTNYHVIESEVDPEYEGFSRLSILPANGRGERIPARVVGWDKNLDVALLKTEREAPFVFSLTSSPDVLQGERVLALGSPAGLESTVTSGIVSALQRPFLPLGTAIQVDAPVNPGNSGGPLVTPDGKVIGLVFAGAPDFQGLNFAVDIDFIVPILPRLYSGAEVERSWMGFGVYDGPDGIKVNYLFPEGPAEVSGIPLGAKVERLNGIPVIQPADIHRLLSSLNTGSLVTINWSKGDTQSESYIVLQKRGRNPLLKALESDGPISLTSHILGMDLESVGDPGGRNFRVLKTYVGTAADQLNLSEGDPITLLNWQVDPEHETLLVQLFLKRRLGGYLESSVQFGLELNPFLMF